MDGYVLRGVCDMTLAEILSWLEKAYTHGTKGDATIEGFRKWFG